MVVETEEVAPWLSSLPLAPVFQPSPEEFVDPIAYILKIEKEASQYGICKIIPPLSRAPEATVLSNLNQSLTGIQEAAAAAGGTPAPAAAALAAHGASVPLARSMCATTIAGSSRIVLADTPGSAKFTTRKQQLGWNSRRPRGGSQYRAQKLVWESGEYYTLDQFQDKAKSFFNAVLGSTSDEEINPLVVESLFWNAELDKPITIEYANDIPGSAFLDPAGSDSDGSTDEALGAGQKLATSGWNIRNIARSHGSMLKFMPDEVPGVTTPMVYLGMLFSWFAWHVEDHELHSLNYLHSGARKTWYAVPADAALALEDVIRLYGYASRLSPRAAFTLLGEKTTILSPEVLIAAGVPCCRLVQNPGEYVVTFPRAYHLGFSHGFNCGEAANFATPKWLEMARQAAARRASMNHLPMLSHEQLLYLFSMSLRSAPSLESNGSQVVEEAVKAAFVSEVKENNVLMSKLLGFGAEGCVLLKDHHRKLAADEAQHVCLPGVEVIATEKADTQEASDIINPSPVSDDSVKPVCVQSRAFSPERYDSAEDDLQVASLPTPWGALPCATCGILCFASMALVQPAAPLSFKQRKHKARTPTATVATEIPSYSGVCRFNSAHDDATDAPDLADIGQLVDDNKSNTTTLASLPASSPDEPPPPAEPTEKAASGVLDPLQASAAPGTGNESANEGHVSEDEGELRARPDGVVKSADLDAVGLSVDAPWEVVGADHEEFEDKNAPEKEYRSPLTTAEPLLSVFVSSGLCFGGVSSDTPETVPAALEPSPSLETGIADADPSRGPICSFNSESNNLLSTSEHEEDEEEEMEEQEEGEADADLNLKNGSPFKDEAFQFCASNEGPTLEDDASRSSTGSWNFTKGFCRPYVFCPQHAVQAVTSLQPLGGATVLAICHSNLEVIQKAAESLESGAIGWETIPLREASSEEVDIINKAIHLKPDSTPGSNWVTRLGVGSDASHKARQRASTGSDSESRGSDMVVGSWCGREWKASELHPLLGGSKMNSQVASQLMRKSQTGKFQKRIHRSAMAGFMNVALLDKTSKMRREGWEGQDRIMTAAILRKSKRNAVLKTAREQAEGRRKRLKHDMQDTIRQYGLCKQAVFSLECSSEQPELYLEGDLDSPKLRWHDVPVACSPTIRRSDWPSDGPSPTAICSTSHQDTVLDDMQWKSENRAGPSKMAVRLKRKIANQLLAQTKKMRRSGCVENSNLNTHPEEAHATADTVLDCANNSAVQNEQEKQVEEDCPSGSSSDEYSLKVGELESESEVLKTLPCFTSSKKRSCSRVKRATWENLLNRLPPQHSKGEQLQNQDSCPLSCVTESGWTSDDRPKGRKPSGLQGDDSVKGSPAKAKKAGTRKSRVQENHDEANNPFPCDIEGCIMSFCTEQELVQHKKNKCTYKGCGKRFFSHKYLVQHRRVHMDDRPLKCPWQGCSMSFKWAWARTEHIRVHTGERPYACPECDKTFRFVSDFSRHKRNTGHARG